jgi:hypothetical protein
MFPPHYVQTDSGKHTDFNGGYFDVGKAAVT